MIRPASQATPTPATDRYYSAAAVTEWAPDLNRLPSWCELGGVIPLGAPPTMNGTPANHISDRLQSSPPAAEGSAGRFQRWLPMALASASTNSALNLKVRTLNVLGISLEGVELRVSPWIAATFAVVASLVRAF